MSRRVCGDKILIILARNLASPALFVVTKLGGVFLSLNLSWDFGTFSAIDVANKTGTLSQNMMFFLNPNQSTTRALWWEKQKMWNKDT